MGALSPDTTDLIKATALRPTVGTAVGGVVVAIGTAINPVFKAVVGGDAPAWVKAIILIAAIGAWAIVASADMLSRAYAAAHAQPQIIPVPPGMKAQQARIGPDPTYEIAALQFTSSTAEVLYLAVRAGETPAWVGASQLSFI